MDTLIQTAISKHLTSPAIVHIPMDHTRYLNQFPFFFCPNLVNRPTYQKSHFFNFPQYKNLEKYPYPASPISIKNAQTTASKDQALQKVQKRPTFASEPVNFYSPFHRAYGRYQPSQQPLKVKSVKPFQPKPIQAVPLPNLPSQQPLNVKSVEPFQPKPIQAVPVPNFPITTTPKPIQAVPVPNLPIRTTPKPTIRYNYRIEISKGRIMST